MSEERVCPECGAPVQEHQNFCSVKCRKAFHNRRATRGAVLYDMFMSERFDRKGDFSGMDASEMRHLIQTVAAEWHQEDLNAGRPRTWNKVSEWLAMNPWVGNFRRTFHIGVGR